jgi:DnaJ family protein C protein 3
VALFYAKRAAAYTSLKKLGQALRDLDAALEVDGNYTTGYLHRGKLHRQMCSIEDAKSDFQNVIKLKPTHSAAAKELAALSDLQAAFEQLQMLQQVHAGAAAAGGPLPDVSAARQVLDKVYGMAPDCIPAQLLDAQLEMLAGNYEQAIAATGKIVKANPKHLEALQLRGLAYMYLGDHDLAKRHFGEALKYDPDHSPSRKAFNKLKDLDRKRQRATKALESQDFAGAVEAYTAALAVDPQHRQVNKQLQLGLCKVQQQMGKAEEAVLACQAALAIDGQWYEAAKELVRALLSAKRHDEAVVKARELLQQNQQDGEMHQLYAEAEKQQKMAKRKDYYKILGVDQSASTRDVKSAYRRLAQQYHPDKVSASEKEASEAKFRDIAEAYEVLSDDEKRGAYDRGDDLEQQMGGNPFQQGGFHQQDGYTFTFRF